MPFSRRFFSKPIIIMIAEALGTIISLVKYYISPGVTDPPLKLVNISKVNDGDELRHGMQGKLVLSIIYIEEGRVAKSPENFIKENNVVKQIFFFSETMHIADHHLVADQGEPAIRSVRSPNRGRTMKPRYLIMHYTAGSSAESAINWLVNPHANASAHLVEAADGSIMQILPVKIICWHAGIIHWNGLDGMNKHSIGIELDNPGKLKKVGAKWISWFGRSNNKEVVLQAIHKHQLCS